MRPASIVQFERVYLASFVFEEVTIALGWSQLTEKVAARSKIPTNVEQGILIGAVAAFLFLFLLLLYFIARRASNQAKSAFLVLTAFSVWSFVKNLIDTAGALDRLVILDAISRLLMLYGVWLLFRPDAKAWLGSKGAEGPTDPNTFA